MKNKAKSYLVLINGKEYRTFAASPDKAINNIRYRMRLNCYGWWEVPKAHEFDVVEA